MEQFITEWMKMIKNTTITNDELILIRDSFKTKLEGMINQLPRKIAMLNFDLLVKKDHIGINTILEKINDKNTNINLNKFLSYVLKNCFLRILIHGNYDVIKGVKLSENIGSILDISKTHTVNNNETNIIPYINYRNHHADLSGYFIYKEQLISKHNHDHAIINYYQVGEGNISNVFRLNLIKSIVGYVYFTELRIKEQLGYSTKGKIWGKDGYLYFMIMVQGSRVTPDAIDVKIEDVIRVMRQRIENISKTRLNNIVKRITRKIGRRDSSLRDRTNRIWGEIVTQRQYFNIRDITKTFIKENKDQLDKENLLFFFDRIFTKELSKLSIQEYSKNVDKENDTNIYSAKIKRGNDTLPYEPYMVTHTNYFRNRNKYKM